MEVVIEIDRKLVVDLFERYSLVAKDDDIHYDIFQELNLL
jgi:hypothetical protein